MTQKRKTGTSQSNVTEETITSQVDVDPSSSTSPPSVKVVKERLLKPAFTEKYVGSPLTISTLQFATAKAGDVLVVKNSNDTELTLRGVFQIARNDFFFTPDGNFDPNNTLGTRFQEAKLNCRLAPPPTSLFSFATDDFPTCISNIRALEKIFKLEKNEEILSCFQPSLLGVTQIKLSHALFEPKEIQDARNDDTEDLSHNTECLTTQSHDELSDDFAMETWPVTPRCATYLKDLLPTHNICPLPAFDLHGNVIPPLQYEHKLRGATVEAHFALGHHYFKKARRHVYVAIARKILILQEPTALPSSPYKKFRVGARAGKGKERAF